MLRTAQAFYNRISKFKHINSNNKICTNVMSKDPEIFSTDCEI